MKYKVRCAYQTRDCGIREDGKECFTNYGEADSFAYDYAYNNRWGRAVLDVCDDNNGYVASYVYLQEWDDWTFPQVVRKRLDLYQNPFGYLL